MPTKSFGSRVDEDANAFVQLSPKVTDNQAIFFTLNNNALNILNPLKFTKIFFQIFDFMSDLYKTYSIWSNR